MACRSSKYLQNFSFQFTPSPFTPPRQYLYCTVLVVVSEAVPLLLETGVALVCFGNIARPAHW